MKVSKVGVLTEVQIILLEFIFYVELRNNMNISHGKRLSLVDTGNL